MRVRLLALALLSLLPGCGGPSVTASEPKAATTTAAKERAESAPESTPTESDEAAASSEVPRGPSCDDGTCSACGSGICPAGWYCDEKVGGGACSWLSECASKPSCACVTRVLGASCKCREESGGLKVACD